MTTPLETIKQKVAMLRKNGACAGAFNLPDIEWLVEMAEWGQKHAIPSIKSTLDMRVGTKTSILINMNAIAALPKDKT